MRTANAKLLLRNIALQFGCFSHKFLVTAYQKAMSEKIPNGHFNYLVIELGPMCDLSQGSISTRIFDEEQPGVAYSDYDYSQCDGA